MTSSPIRRASALCVAAMGLSAAFAGPAGAAARELFYERTVMVAADEQCRLFTPELGSALAASEAQARGAALRAGASDASLDQMEQRARGRVVAVGCGSPDIALAANRVRQGFAGYSALRRMTYPGDAASWLAVRDAPMRTTIWKLSQAAQFGPDSAVFGLAGRDGPSSLVVAASFHDHATPYTARLIVRDRTAAPDPFLNTFRIGGLGAASLSQRMPPRYATTAFLPEARGDADASLLPTGARQGVAFRFPRAAEADLMALDPREAVAIEFVFAGAQGDEVRTAYFEVGDFAAGRAFLLADQR